MSRVNRTHSRSIRYHGRIILPNEYPNKPPQFLFCTHNGRFEVGKKICLSISQHHPEEWQAAWGVRAALTAIRSFMMTKADGVFRPLATAGIPLGFSHVFGF